ncbi:TPA: hypothetical protein IAB95_04725 [Candidatus Ventrenecus avicola]|nr:hypothetical protein [Candidatus Ventrenecus avicola]
MSKYCSDCAFLNLKDKKMDGIYKCKKCKSYVNTTMDACNQFSLDYSRNWYSKSTLYDEGKNVSTNTTPMASYVVILIILSILYFIGKLNGY